MPPEITFRLSHYLTPGSHKVALQKGVDAKIATSLPQLQKDTNAFSTKNRPGCQPSLLKSEPKELFLSYNVKCNLKTSDPSGHDVKIRFDVPTVEDDTKSKDLDIRTSCTCPAFLYWGGQWNSHMRDALEGTPRPELTAPTERLDLRSQFVICKHIAAVSERILPSVQHNINNLIRTRKVKENKDKDKDKDAPQTKRRQTLEQRQEDMRKRLQKEKERRKRNQQIQKKLLEGIRRREKTPDRIIERDTPSTPEQREVQPTVDTKVIPTAPVTETPEAPTPAAPKLNPRKQPIVVRDQEATTGDHLPAQAPAAPQKMPRMTKDDRAQMDALMKTTEEEEEING